MIMTKEELEAEIRRIEESAFHLPSRLLSEEQLRDMFFEADLAEQETLHKRKVELARRELDKLLDIPSIRPEFWGLPNDTTP